MDTTPWLIIGLGNPGSRYATTRHNVGYLGLDELADDLTPGGYSSFSAHKKTGSYVAEGTMDVHGQPTKVILARSTEFMNLSGRSVAALAKYYKIPADHIIVIHDELDLDPGVARIKRGGGENGHNGLRSTSSALGTKDYYRIRVGVGRPPGRQAPADFVLGNFNSSEREELPITLGTVSRAVQALITEGMDSAQNTIHAL